MARKYQYNYVIMDENKIPNVKLNDDGSYDVDFCFSWSPQNEIAIKGTINKGYGVKIYKSKRKAPEFIKVGKDG